MDVNVIMNYLPLIFGIALILVLGISVVVALVRGLFKARVRAGGILICFLLAILITGILKSTAGSFSDSVEQTFRSTLANESVDWFFNLFQQSQQLREAFAGASGALVAPVIFVIVFLALQFLSWVIHLIVTLILRKKIKELDEKSSLSRLRACLLGAAQGLLIFFVLMVPVYAYGTMAGTVAEDVAPREESAELAEESADEAQATAFAFNGRDMQLVNGVAAQSTGSFRNNVFYKLYGALGGNALCNSLTEFRVNGEKTSLMQEVDAIGDFAARIVQLSQAGGVENYEERQAQAIRELSESFGNSKLLQVVTGEVIYSVSDGWLNGRDVLGLEKPDVGETIAPAFDSLLEALRRDARDPERLRADIGTVGNVASVLVKEGVMKQIANGEGDEEKLLEALSRGTVVRDIVIALGDNDSLKNLIPEMTNMGMRAIGTLILNLPENADEIFEQYLDEIAQAINEVLTTNATHRRKTEMLAERFLQALEKSGVDIQIDPLIAELYADAILTDIEESGLSTVTRQDVAEFFEIYAAMNEEKEKGSSAPLASEGEKQFQSRLYGGKTLNGLASSGVGKLAAITRRIAAASTEDESAFRQTVLELKVEYHISVKIENLAPNAFTADVLKATVTIREGSFPSVAVTVESLLVDVQKATEQINAENLYEEAEKIGAVLEATAKIAQALSEGEGEFDMQKLGDVSQQLGEVLERLDDSKTFNQKAEVLVKALFQNENVLQGMGIDLVTATEFANAVCEEQDGKKVDYSATIESVSISTTISNKISESNEPLTEQEIADLLRSMTPQTANLLQMYLSEERVSGYGLPAAATPLLRALFREMANKGKYPDYSNQTAALLQIFELARTAVRNIGAKTLFNHGAVPGAMNVTAEEAVQTVMSSSMVGNAAVAVMLENGEVKPAMFNPFGLKMPVGGADYRACKAAVEQYAKDHPDSVQTLKAIAALFGVQVDF